MLAQAFGHVVKCKGGANLAEKILAEKEGGRRVSQLSSPLQFICSNLGGTRREFFKQGFFKQTKLLKIMLIRL